MLEVNGDKLVNFYNFICSYRVESIIKQSIDWG